MEVAVLDKKGQDTGRKVNLVESIYGIDSNGHAMYFRCKAVFG